MDTCVFKLMKNILALCVRKKEAKNDMRESPIDKSPEIQALNF